MFNTFPVNVYKPGTKLIVTSKNLSKLLPGSIIHIIKNNTEYSFPGFNKDNTLKNINYGYIDPKAAPLIMYSVLIERIGKSGKTRINESNILLPIFKNDPTTFFKDGNKEILEITNNSPIDLKTVSIETLKYWCLSRLLFLNSINKYYMPKTIPQTAIAIKSIDKTIKYPQITKIFKYLTHHNENSEEQINNFLLGADLDSFLKEMAALEAYSSYSKIKYLLNTILTLKVATGWLLASEDKTANWKLLDSNMITILTAAKPLLNNDINNYNLSIFNKNIIMADLFVELLTTIA